MVGQLTTLLLRSHVLRRSGRLRFDTDVIPGISNNFRNPKIGDFHAPTFVEEEIRGLDIAMNDPVIVSELKRIAKRRNYGERLSWREFPGPQQLPQIHPIHKLHEEEIESTRLTEVMHRHDVGMIERRQGMGLTHEPLCEVGIRDPLGCHEFQRHRSIQRFLPRFVHHTHTSTAQALDDLELRKVRRDLLWRQRGLWRSAILRKNRLGFEVQSQKAARTQSRGSVGGKWRATLGTSLQWMTAHAL